MGTIKWHFNELPRGSKIREPVNSEFFATDAISNPGEALVREGIQNSLDAVRAGEIVLIRIYLSGAGNGLSPEKLAPFTADMWGHLEASGNGLNNVPARNDNCPFLVFEDFGTTGLTGDPGEPYPPRDGSQNPFFYFFRAEGRSGKGAEARGRWGIGKQVFPRASRISTVFGLTVRADDMRSMLMGQTVLKSHWTDDTCCQDGWFGNKDEGKVIVMPTEDSKVLDNFRKTFDLQRGATEPGLSLVVPWCDSEIDEDWIVKSVLRDYFYPILNGKLQAIVETPSVKAVLGCESIRDEINRIGGELAKELNPLIDLAQWAREVGQNQVVALLAPPVDSALRWEPSLFSEDATKRLRDVFAKGEKLALSVPLSIRKKGADTENSFFCIYMVRDDNEQDSHPIFIRGGIIISDVRSPRTRGIRALVVVEDGPLASMLGDSENPAHTQWQKDGSNFKGKYIYGPALINFVTHSVSEVVRHITANDTEEDRTLLADVFSIPAPPDEESAPNVIRPHEVPKPGPNPPPGPPPIPPRPHNIRISKIAGGFTVIPASPGSVLPKHLDIVVAYDVRRGNAFSKYRAADFDIGQSPIDVETSGVEVLEKIGNRISLGIQDNDFKLSVRGFDERRDLRISVKLRPGGDRDDD